MATGNIRISIVNWEKYNPRTDRKKHSWFRLENDFINDEKLFRLAPLEKFVWVCLLAFKSKKTEEIIDLDPEYLACQLKIKKNVVISTIQKLSLSGALTIHETVTTGNQLVSTGSPTYDTNERTNDTNTIDQNKFDLERLYFLYPRKIGKAKGLAQLKVKIKSLEDFHKFEKAVKNYSEYCTSHVTESRFIKHFSTFVAVWEDWLEPKKEFKIVQKTDIDAILRGKAVNGQA